MVLTLAEPAFYLSEAGAPSNPYIFLPDFSGKTAGSYVRQDYFDELTPAEFKQFMQFLAPYQPKVQSGQLSESRFLSGMFDNMRNRQKQRQDRRQDRKDTKAAAQAEIKAARAQAIREGRGFDWNNLVSSVGNVAQAVGNTVAPGAGGIRGIMQQLQPGAAGMPQPQMQPAQTRPGFFDGEIFGIPKKIAYPAALLTTLYFLSNRK